ncbi:hypothetical protein [Helicobacter felis]|uniref:hypothetical protein n=1 Tax=Helicobacter felis TaxID=214 RepID=UPI000CF1777A|nr:hypothetical protein [Helicobacter felis]
MYAYVFVILNQKVGVFKRTQQGGLIFVCMQEAGADFFTNFIEIYNIDPCKARDFCFVWEEGCDPTSLPYFKPQLEGSVWGASLLCDLLNILYTQHNLKACLKDSLGHCLGEARDSHILYTNANLSPQESLSPGVLPHNTQSEWQVEQMQETQRLEEARGKKHLKPQSPQPTNCKLGRQGGDEAPSQNETNH